MVEEAMSIRMFQPPHFVPAAYDRVIFLAGTIEMGKAAEWQKEAFALFEVEYKNTPRLHNTDIAVLNPRRDDFDPDMEQSIRNEPFVDQVTWEMDGLDRADAILFQFEPDCLSPVSLLELGTYKDKENLVVHCRDGYLRKGNVDIWCARHGITQWHSLSLSVGHIIRNLRGVPREPRR